MTWGGGFKRNTRARFVTDESSAAASWDSSCKNSWDFCKVAVTLVGYSSTELDLRHRGRG